MPVSRPGFVVLRSIGGDRWDVVCEVPRRPGLPARKARAQAIRDAVGREPEPGEQFAAVLRSEWRIALDY